MTRQPSFRDVEKLSAYLDNQLSQAETTRLESRIASNPGFTAALEAMRQSRSLLRHLPQRRAPRNFTLTPKMAGLRAPTPRVVPILRYATVLATILLVITFAANTLAPMMAATQAVAPYGIGGGGGAEGPGLAETAPTEEMMAAAPVPPAAEATTSPAELAATPTPEDSDSRFAIEPTLANKVGETALEDTAPLLAPEPEKPLGFIPPTRQTALFVVAVICGLAALFLYWNSQHAFRHKVKKQE